MANDLNQCQFIGRLGKDPEQRFMGNGEGVTSFSLAVGWKGKDKEGTEWVNVTAFGKLAEICAQYLTKGSQVFIQGRMKTDEYEKDGIKRYSTKIVADRMQMLGGKSDRAPADDRAGTTASDYAKATGKDAPPANKQTDGGFGAMDDDIPFAPIGRKMGMLS